MMKTQPKVWKPNQADKLAVGDLVKLSCVWTDNPDYAGFRANEDSEEYYVVLALHTNRRYVHRIFGQNTQVEYEFHESFLEKI